MQSRVITSRCCRERAWTWPRVGNAHVRGPVLVIDTSSSREMLYSYVRVSRGKGRSTLSKSQRQGLAWSGPSSSSGMLSEQIFSFQQCDKTLDLQCWCHPHDHCTSSFQAICERSTVPSFNLPPSQVRHRLARTHYVYIRNVGKFWNSQVSTGLG